MVARLSFFALALLAIGAVLVGASELSSDPASATGAEAIQVEAGGSHTCALTSDLGVKCWGDNISGQLGDGTETDRLTPVDVVGLENVTEIAVGGSHSCALTAGGGVKCWGGNAVGQLGDGTETSRNEPVEVAGLGGVTTIAAGRWHTCVLTTVGGVKCWGLNSNGQLGDGTEIDRQTPVDVDGLSEGMSAIAAGELHTCAASDSSLAFTFCWGWLERGRLGNGSFNPDANSTTPELVCDNGVCSAFLTDVTDLAAAGSHSCAVTAVGQVKCWGSNRDHQLGNSETVGDFRDTAALATGLDSGYVAVSVGTPAGRLGGGHSCALHEDGGVKCWGHNAAGQVGDGTIEGRPKPVDVIELDGGAWGISAGNEHTCALMILDGGVKCWGHNFFGQLGTGDTEDALSPVDVVGFGDKGPMIIPTDTPEPTDTPVPGGLVGDVDCSGSVNAIDAALILQFVAGLLGSLPCPDGADTNGDGSVNSIDAALILQFSAGLVPSLPP